MASISLRGHILHQKKWGSASSELRSVDPKQRSEVEVEGYKQKKIQIIPLNLDLDRLFRISEAKFETSVLVSSAGSSKAHYSLSLINYQLKVDKCQ